MSIDKKGYGIQKDSPCWDAGILSRSPSLAPDNSPINKTYEGISGQPGENGSRNLLKVIPFVVSTKIVAKQKSI
ncbi:hypothetical protein C8J56DRAFT_1171377 [Mycena floridula]|nr:hypothetical protein C8J56DRAFT_1171377 [Mycena floridula]